MSARVASAPRRRTASRRPGACGRPTTPSWTRTTMATSFSGCMSRRKPISNSSSVVSRYGDPVEDGFGSGRAVRRQRLVSYRPRSETPGIDVVRLAHVIVDPIIETKDRRIVATPSPALPSVPPGTPRPESNPSSHAAAPRCRTRSMPSAPAPTPAPTRTPTGKRPRTYMSTNTLSRHRPAVDYCRPRSTDRPTPLAVNHPLVRVIFRDHAASSIS